MAIFSLNSTKNLPGGEGGLLVTDNAEYRGRANMVRMFGEYMTEEEGRSYVAYTLGWNYRTQEMPAALPAVSCTGSIGTTKTPERTANICPGNWPRSRVSNPPIFPNTVYPISNEGF